MCWIARTIVSSVTSQLYIEHIYSRFCPQLYVGLICNLIVFPVNFLVVTLFRKSRPRKKRPSRIQQALQTNGYQYQTAQSVQGSTSDVKKLIDSKEDQSSVSGRGIVCLHN